MDTFRPNFKSDGRWFESSRGHHQGLADRPVSPRNSALILAEPATETQVTKLYEVGRDAGGMQVVSSAGCNLGRYPRPRPETLLGWLERLDRSDGHWIWPGGLSGGYAHVTYRVDGRDKKVDAKLHVLLYEIFVGPVEPGLLLDHKCRRRPCCNPDCLEPVTNQVNVIRGVHGRAREAAIEAGQIVLEVAA